MSALFAEAGPNENLEAAMTGLLTLPEIILYCIKLSGRERERERQRDPCGSHPSVYVTLY